MNRITIGREDLGTDPWEAITVLKGQRDEARLVVAEILGELDSIAGPWSTRAARVKLSDWRERAGLRKLNRDLTSAALN